MLIVFRVLQGLGGGALQPISQAILVESFPREKQGMAMAVYGMGVVVAPVIGPTLGGWITDNFSWRWIFFINIPVGILSLVLTSALISRPAVPACARRSGRACSIDYIGLGLLALGLGVARNRARRRAAQRLVRLELDRRLRGHRRRRPGRRWSSGSCGRSDPVIDFHVLKDRNFALATVSMLLLGFVLYGSTALLPLFLQTLLGYTAMLSGMVLSPGGIAI